MAPGNHGHIGQCISHSSIKWLLARRDSIGISGDYAPFNWLKLKIFLARLRDLHATFRSASLMSKAGGDAKSERGYSGYEVTSGGATDDGELVDWGSLLGVIVNFSVVLVTKLLLLHWHAHLFQRLLPSNHVLGLLLLCFFVVVCL